MSNNLNSIESFQVNTVYKQPPILQMILDAGLKPTPTTVFTYGNKIYIPSGERISDNLLVHEKVHVGQQLFYTPPQVTPLEEGKPMPKEGPDGWWDRYLKDPEFRLSQEVEAYREQYRYFCDRHSNYRKQGAFLAAIAQDLSGPMYGEILSFDEAIKLISK